MNTQQQAKPNFIVQVDRPVELAFEIGGKRFWQFVDPMNTPCLRGLSALTVYDELRMRTTYEHLEKENEFMTERFKKLEEALDGKNGRIQLSKAFEQIRAMKEVVAYRKERMQIMINADLIYKLASVVFFTEEENPYKYDHEYAKKKIELWKQHEGMYDFFLREPLIRLLPFLEELQGTSPTSLEAMAKVASRIVQFQLNTLGGTPSS